MVFVAGSFHEKYTKYGDFYVPDPDYFGQQTYISTYHNEVLVHLAYA
jgi:hypothetical protein